MKREKKIIWGIILGFVFCLLSIFIPKSVTSVVDLREAVFGLPFWFLKQDLTADDHSFATIISIASPWENPTDIRLMGFLGSWTVWSIFTVLIIEVIFYFKKNRFVV